MAQKIDLDLNSFGVAAGTKETLEKMQVKLDAFQRWAQIVEARQFQFQEGILALIGNFETLVGLLMSGEPITEEAIQAGREAFLEKIREHQEQAKVAAAKPKIWTPDTKLS